MNKYITLPSLFLLAAVFPFKSYCQATSSFEPLPYSFPEEGTFEMANFNGDSLLDMVVLSGEAPFTLKFYKAIAADTFEQEKELALEGAFMSGLEILDINGDNLPDIFTLGMADADSAAGHLFLGDSDFNFRPVAMPIDFSSVQTYLWFDFNEDGRQDLFISGISGNVNRSLILVQEEEEFRVLKTNFFEKKIKNLLRIADPRPTFYVFTPSATEEVFPSGLYTFKDGGFSFVETKLPSYASAVLAQGDLNHDGQWDLFASGTAKDGKKVNGVFLRQGSDYEFLPLDLEQKDVIQAEVADIDNDGLADIVAGIVEGGETKTYAASIASSFEFSLLPVEGTQIYLSDYNLDGLIEILATQSESITIYKNSSSEQNAAPKAPESLLSLPTKEGIFFSWSKGEDDKTAASSLSYDIMIREKGDSLYYKSSLVDEKTGYDKHFGFGSMGPDLVYQLEGSPIGFYDVYLSAFDNAHFTGPTSMVVFAGNGNGICYLADCFKSYEKDTLLCKPIEANLNTFFETEAMYWVSYSQGYLGKANVTHELDETDVLYGITIREDCIELLIVNVTVPTSETFTYQLDACANDTLQLPAGTEAETYLWYNTLGDSLSTAPELSFVAQKTDTIFLSRDAAISACPKVDTFFIEVFPLPSLAISEATTIRAGENLLLQAWGAEQYEWFPKESINNAFSAAISVSPQQTTTYVVKASTAAGCIQYDSVEVTVVNDLFVPTLFTPNADGKNDRLEIIGSGIKQLRFLVYDSSGTLVFEANSVEEARRGWDGMYKGKPVPPGNLVWRIQGKFSDGLPLQFASKTKGFITLIR